MDHSTHGRMDQSARKHTEPTVTVRSEFKMSLCTPGVTFLKIPLKIAPLDFRGFPYFPGFLCDFFCYRIFYWIPYKVL